MSDGPSRRRLWPRVSTWRLVLIAKSLIAYVRGNPAYLDARYPDEQIGVGSWGDLELIRYGNDGNFSMGKYCMIAQGTRVMLGGNHRVDWVTTYAFSVLWPAWTHVEGHPAKGSDVHIGSDVWIGRDTTIKSGVTIGHGAVIGSCSFVTKDVPPYAIFGGNPAKFLRYRFPADVIERLLAVAWWDWSEERINAAMPLLLSDDIEAFLEWAQSSETSRA